MEKARVSLSLPLYLSLSLYRTQWKLAYRLAATLCAGAAAVKSSN